MRMLGLTVCALGFLTLAMPAYADHHEGDMGGKHPMMEKIDTDGDGQVSKAEFMAMHTERFEKMDANSDGVLSKDEMKAGHEKMRDKMKDKMHKMKKEHMDSSDE